jgi:hypothetical protein
MLSLVMLALIATLPIQLNVEHAGCADCGQLSESELEAELNQTQTASSAPRNSSAASALYAKGSNNNNSNFPAWIKPALGIAVVILGIALASRTVLRKLFIFKTKNRNYGGAKASHSQDYHRDAWKAKRAHRKNSR